MKNCIKIKIIRKNKKVDRDKKKIKYLKFDFVFVFKWLFFIIK